MPVLSISETFRASSRDCGRVILAHVASSSLVVNANVVADPCLISKASRASRITLAKCHRMRSLWSESGTNKPPFVNSTSVP